MNIEASAWIESNYEWLVQEFNNKWLGASSDGYVVVGETFDLALQETLKREVHLSDIVFIYLTTEIIQ